MYIRQTKKLNDAQKEYIHNNISMNMKKTAFTSAQFSTSHAVCPPEYVDTNTSHVRQPPRGVGNKQVNGALDVIAEEQLTSENNASNPVDSTKQNDTELDNMDVDFGNEMPDFPSSMVEQRFALRRRLLNKACEEFGDSELFRKMFRRQMFLPAHKPFNNVSLRYCPIEKTGSTTWVNLFEAIDAFWQDKNATASDVLPSLTYRHGYEGRVWKQVRTLQLQVRGVTEKSLVFVREPYARLLSAYVDKLFSPNSLFWGTTGRYIVTKFRHNPAAHSLRCGHDVTFPEFIKYVIHAQETGENRDGHFVPTHDHCDLCGSRYDYVGHLETLHQDMPYLLTVIQSPINYTHAFDQETLRNNADWVFSKMRQGLSACISMKEAGRRLWRKWQIRGLISKGERFPFTDAAMHLVTATAFFHAGLAAMQRSDSTGKKSQKSGALTQAYASVPLEDRLKLKQLLLLDFQMFGFPSQPESVFPTSSNHTDGFNYFKP
jgi:hypothetical protein